MLGHSPIREDHSFDVQIEHVEIMPMLVKFRHGEDYLLAGPHKSKHKSRFKEGKQKEIEKTRKEETSKKKERNRKIKTKEKKKRNRKEKRKTREETKKLKKINSSITSAQLESENCVNVCVLKNINRLN